MKLERQDRNIAVIDVTIVIAVGEPRCDFAQVVSPIGSQHSAQKDCGLGVLPFTTMNFMCRLPMRSRSLINSIVRSRRTAPSYGGWFECHIGLQSVIP
jgi:hypothetical protein